MFVDNMINAPSRAAQFVGELTFPRRRLAKSSPKKPANQTAIGLKNKTPAPFDAGLVKTNQGHFRRRNSSRLKLPKPANASVDGSGAGSTEVSKP